MRKHEKNARRGSLVQSVLVVFGSDEKRPNIHDIFDSWMDQKIVTTLLLMLLCLLDALLLLLRYCIRGGGGHHCFSCVALDCLL